MRAKLVMDETGLDLLDHLTPHGRDVIDRTGGRIDREKLHQLEYAHRIGVEPGIRGDMFLIASANARTDLRPLIRYGRKDEIAS